MAEINTSSYPTAPAAPLNPIAEAQALTNLQQSEMQLNLGRLNTLRSTFGTLVTKPDLTQRDVINAAGSLVAGRVLPHQFIAGQLATMPNDPAKLRQWVQQHLNQVMSTQERMNAAYGVPGMVQTGDQQIPITVNQNPLGVRPGVQRSVQAPGTVPSFQNELGPAERAAGVPALTPGNVPVQPRLGQVVDPRGNARPPAQVAAAVAQAPIRTGQAPGEAEAQTTEGAAGGQALVRGRERAATFTQEIQPLQKASEALERLGPQGTGPTTENLNYLRQAGIALGIPGAQNWQNATTDYETAKKSLTQYVTANSQGQGTDQRLTAAFGGSPNMQMTQATALQLTNAALSLRRMEQAQHQAFERSGQPPSRYQQFVQNFNREQDPRAYGFDLMTRQQQQNLIQSLRGEERSKFRRSLEAAAQAGIINPR
jgi:hypothetical protein